MNFLTPASFLLAALALPILLLYMLKLRRRQVLVSSTMLWQRLLRDRQANTPWQRLKRNLLLILQLLILGALVFSLARPFLPLPTIASGSTVLLVDGSASMQATDVTPNRFAAAQEVAREIIRDQTARARTTILLVGEQPQVLIAEESDKTALLRALNTAQPGQGTADWEAAAVVASGVIRTSTEDSKIVLISDGGIPAGALPGLPGETRYLNIGNGDDNLAVAALAARPGQSGVELFARVENYGAQERQATLSFYAGSNLIASEPVSVGAKSSTQYVISDLPTEETVYEARLTHRNGSQTNLDQLHLDDQAFAVYRHPATSRVLLSSVNPDGNYFLEQLLNLLPSITAYRTLDNSSKAQELPEEPFDLYIFDGLLPDLLPDGNLLLINPPANELFTVQGTYTPETNFRLHEHQLTRFLDWGEVHIARAQLIQLPGWAELLVSADDEPLVFAGETQGRRIAVLAFDLHDSDLPLRVAYPILLANLIEYLKPKGNVVFPEQLAPGESLILPVQTGIQQVEIISPGGESQLLLPDENGVSYTDVFSLGLYEVRMESQDRAYQDFFAVNLFDANESDLTPRESVQIGRRTLEASISTETGQREIWWVFALIGIGLLVVEWWIYHRGQSPSITIWQHFRARILGSRSG